MIRCEMVRINMLDEDGMRAVLDVPAYTRPAHELRDLAIAKLDEYLTQARGGASTVSLGDFALYLIAQAALEPHVQ